MMGSLRAGSPIFKQISLALLSTKKQSTEGHIRGVWHAGAEAHLPPPKASLVPTHHAGGEKSTGGGGLTQKSVVPVIVRQEPLVDSTHQEVVRQARGLGPHQEEACGDVDGLVGQGDETQVLPRLAEP